MSEAAKLQLPDGSTVDLPVVIGTEGEPSVDISKLRAQTGYVTLDDGYGNTGSCLSNITFIDGDKGRSRPWPRSRRSSRRPSCSSGANCPPRPSGAASASCWVTTPRSLRR